MADITQAPQATPTATYLKDYQPPAYLVEQIELVFELDEDDTLVHNTMRCVRNPACRDNEPAFVLNGLELELKSIQLDGRTLSEADYVIQDEQLILHQVPERFTLNITTCIHPAKNTALEGLYHSGKMLCTQCEAEGFRRMSYFPDRPDVMSTYRVTLQADKEKYPVLLSNGNLIEQGELEGGRHYAVWQDPSLKPSYLFALVAGQLVYLEDSFTTCGGREVVLRVYVEPENRHKCDHAMECLKQSMLWDEQTYGREYDLDIFMIVAVNDFNMGAMENKGLNIFNASCVLASPDTATDNDYYKIQSIIGHEYFHNWSGNRVTCRDWFQLSLKEGFTVFRDQEFSSDLNSRPVQRIDDVDILRNHQFPQDAGPMAHPVRPDHYIEISNFYTVTIYNKGAEVVRMIRNLVGAEGFRKGTDLYFSRYDGQAVTTDDFVTAMEEANGIDLSQFKNWYGQAGTPELHVSDSYDAESKRYTLSVKQSCAPTPGQDEKQPFHIPLAVGLLDEQGRDIPLHLAGGVGGDSETTQVLHIKQVEEEFVFEDVPCRPVPSLLRDFSAPVIIHKPSSDEELAFLFAHDSNAFNRWDAGQRLGIKIIKSLVRDHQDGRTLVLPEFYIEAFRKVLSDKDLDKSLAARALSLPSENYLAEQYELIDVDAIHEVREFVRKSLAEALYPELRSVYEQNKSDGPYRFNAQEMAQRALMNSCLSYLMEVADAEVVQLCVAQFKANQNMSNVIAALAALVDYAGDERVEALKQFYAQWQHDPQVVEKWFALQAGSRLPDTIERVKALTQHKAFSLTNPNKVRALIGRFCLANPHFHAATGEGYRLLSEYVIKLDAMNPQIAARLVQGFARWKRYDEGRKALMQAELNKILQQETISKDVYEVAAKILGKES